jgi:hypothetical protein
VQKSKGEGSSQKRIPKGNDSQKSKSKSKGNSNSNGSGGGGNAAAFRLLLEDA